MRQRRYHETGRSRAASSTHVPGVGATKGFDRGKRRHLNGVVIGRCDCAICSASRNSTDG
jgi:hypothetical protein